MSEYDFIEQMVCETISEKTTDIGSDLRFEPMADVHLSLSLDEERKCYIMRFSNENIEFPINWGPFKNRISKEFYLTKGDEHAEILELFEQIFGHDIKSVKFTILNGKTYFPLNKVA